MKTGIELIAEERARQISAEGWTPEHDDEHARGELAVAGACYAMRAAHADTGHNPPGPWPWDQSWWKPRDPMRNLVRAGALIAAEIDRLQRAGNPTK